MKIDIPLAKDMTQLAEKSHQAKIQKEEKERKLHKDSLDSHIEESIQYLIKNIKKASENGKFTTSYKFPERFLLIGKIGYVSLTSQDIRYMLPKIAKVFKEKGYCVTEREYPQKTIFIEWF